MNTFTQRFILVAQLTFVLFVLFLSGCSRSEARVSDGTRAAGAGGGTSGAERPAKTADGMTRQLSRRAKAFETASERTWKHVGSQPLDECHDPIRIGCSAQGLGWLVTSLVPPPETQAMGNKAMSEPKPPLKDGKLPEPLWCAEKFELVPGEAIFLAAGCAEWIGTLEPAGGLWDY